MRLKLWGVAIISCAALSVMASYTDAIPYYFFPHLGDFTMGRIVALWSGLTSLFFIWFICRGQLTEYFKLPKINARLGIAFLVASLQFGSTTFEWLRHGHSLSTYGKATIFLLGIGFSEELQARGLLFGLLRKLGLWPAVIISSTFFGLLHLNNFWFGGKNLYATLGQVLTAGSFGVLACGLMIFTQSIWVPVLVHALTDTSILLVGAPASQGGVADPYVHAPSLADWGFTLIYCALTIGSGVLLLLKKERYDRISAFFGLTLP